MGQQMQQSVAPPPQKKEPNWLVAVIVTAVLGGIIQIFVNHFDVIAAAISTGLNHINWMIFWSSCLGFLRNSLWQTISTFISTIVAAIGLLQGVFSSRKKYQQIPRDVKSKKR